jgi:hypothetical protein
MKNEKSISGKVAKLTLAFFLFLPAALFGQTNFTGTWTFNESKSVLGDAQGPRMEAKTLVVTQQGNEIQVKRTSTGFDGNEMIQNEKYTLDGKESVNTGMMDSKVKSILTWSADKKELTFTKVISFAMNGETQEMKSIEKWSLSPDSKTLTLKSSMNTPMGDMNTTLAYDKKE